jgi:hypothetical protein
MKKTQNSKNLIQAYNGDKPKRYAVSTTSLAVTPATLFMWIGVALQIRVQHFCADVVSVMALQILCHLECYKKRFVRDTNLGFL